MSQNSARGFNNTITMSGDVSGILEKATVTALQGKAISSSAPTTNYILGWNGSDWISTNALPAANVVSISKVITTSSTYTIGNLDACIVTTASGTVTINFPQTATTGRVIILANNQPGIYGFSVVPYSGTTIDGNSTSFSLSSGTIYTCYDGSNWISLTASS